MSTVRRCSRCGALLDPLDPEARCAACLLQVALQESTDSDGTIPHLLPVLHAGERVGRYRIVDTLGEGGMGIVYLAEQREPLQRLVALKVLRDEIASKSMLARFEAERQALALMSHPGIAHIYDAGITEHGTSYLVMEHVAGLPITDYCDQQQLDTRERLELFLKVCEAIQHAHQRGVIHRDIKPSNVLIAAEGDKPVPKVIDFGVAKALEQRLTEKTLSTHLGAFVGTPGYMSPEQAGVSALDMDTRTDIYSLGVLLYELMVGTLPFEAERLRDAGWAGMMRIIQEEEPPRPSSRLSTVEGKVTDVARRRRTEPRALRRLVKGDVDWITLKALEKDRARRYASISELMGDIQRHLNDEPVTASPPSLSYRMNKAAHRHRGAFAATAIVLTAISAGFVIATIQYLRAESARREARRELVRFNISTGMTLADAGDRLSALPWLVEALALEEDAKRQDVHRHRITSTLADIPTLYRLWIHGAAVRDAQFSPDGNAVATASADKSARVWSVATGEATTPALIHDSAVVCVEFSPDGGRLLTASEDGKGRVWDVNTGQLLFILEHAAAVNRITMNAAGTQLLTASNDDTAVVWDAKQGKRLLSVTHAGDVTWAAFSPDDESFVTTSADSTARIWDARNGRARTPPLRHGTPPGINMASFNRDGRLVASAGNDWRVRVWDVGTGAALPTSRDIEQPVGMVEFSPSGKLILAGGTDDKVHVWEAGSEKPLIPPLKLESPATAVRFGPDGLVASVGEATGKVHMWRLEPGSAYSAPLPHGTNVRAIRFHHSGRFLLTASDDGTARIWDLSTTEPVVPILRDILWGGLTADGRAVVTATGSPTVAVGWARAWDATSGDPATPPLRHRGWTTRAVSHDGRLMATASLDGTARVWDLRTGEPVTPPLVHPYPDVVHVAFSPDGRRVVTAAGGTSGTPGGAHVWDVATGQQLIGPLRHKDMVWRADFAPDGQRIITVGYDSAARIWDAATGKPLTSVLEHGGDVRGVAVRHDAKQFATASYDGNIRVFDLTTGRLMFPPRLADGTPYHVEFSPTNSIIASAAASTVQLWNGGTLEETVPPIRHPGYVFRTDFSPDGRWLLTMSLAPGMSRLWEVETGEPVSPARILRNSYWGPNSTSGLKQLNTPPSWEFVADPRPVDDLRRLAELLAGRKRTRDTAGLTQLRPSELNDRWKSFRSKFPQAFEASPEKRQAWHREKAMALAQRFRWRNVVKHLNQALVVAANWTLLVRRASAHAELDDWPRAEADLSAALVRIPGELQPTYQLALIHLLRRNSAALKALRATTMRRWSETKNPDRARWAAHLMVLAPIADETARAQAVKWAETALAAEPMRPDRVALHAAALIRGGRFQEGTALLRRAVSANAALFPGPPTASALAYLAIGLSGLGQHTEAARWLSQAASELHRMDSIAKRARLAMDELGAQDGAWWHDEEAWVRLQAPRWWHREELRVLLEEIRHDGPHVTTTH